MLILTWTMERRLGALTSSPPSWAYTALCAEGATMVVAEREAEQEREAN